MPGTGPLYATLPFDNSKSLSKSSKVVVDGWWIEATTKNFTASDEQHRKFSLTDLVLLSKLLHKADDLPASC